MNFGSGGNMKPKAWRDIWGSGQAIGQITDAPPVAELVERLKAEFDQARRNFLMRASTWTCICRSSNCSRGASTEELGEFREILDARYHDPTVSRTMLKP
jgi:hypothetical protein